MASWARLAVSDGFDVASVRSEVSEMARGAGISGSWDQDGALVRRRGDLHTEGAA